MTCTLGETCFIQQYVDRDATEGWKDYTCSGLSYNGHTGTDIRVPDLVDMDQGWTVTAAAPGVVRATRDGVDDAFLTPERREALQGKGCGNGVVIDHADGWQTQYCHLRKGSIAVKSGEAVPAGAPLGEVGLSGFTDFPHLEFVVRQNGKIVDPFAPNDITSCGTPQTTLWEETPVYQPGGLLDAGFSDAVPEFSAIKAGIAGAATLPSDAGALVLWGYAFGAQAGDKMDMVITDPRGRDVIRHSADLDRTQTQLFRATGRRLRAPQWLPGTYQGHVALMRNGIEVDSTEISIEITR